MGPHEYTEARPGTYQAQDGEDRWLESYFAGKRDGVYLEVGAYDGKVLSNTFHFESIGWAGVLVEPDPAKAAQCRANRPKSHVFACAAVGDPSIREVPFSRVAGGEVYSTTVLTAEHRQRIESYGLTLATEMVPAMSVDTMLSQAQVTRLDFASIDVEEGELEVLRGFNLRRWRPACVLVEENGPQRRPAIRQAFRRQGYGFLTSIGFNDVYVPCRVGIVDRWRYSRRRNERSP